MKKGIFTKSILILFAIVLAVSCNQSGYPLPDPDNTGSDKLISIDDYEELYTDGPITVTATFESGEKEITVPEAVIKEAVAKLTPEAGTTVRSVTIVYGGVTFTIANVVVPGTAVENPEDDPAYITTEEEFKQFMKGELKASDGATLLKTAFIDGSFTVNLAVGDEYTHADSRLLSLSRGNEVTIEGCVNGDAGLRITASNVEISGFTIKAGTNEHEGKQKPVVKVSGNAENVVLGNLYFDTNGRGIEFNMAKDCKILDCTIEGTGALYGDVQIRNTTGLTIDGLVIEGDYGLVKFDYADTDPAKCSGIEFTNSDINGVIMPSGTGVSLDNISDFKEVKWNEEKLNNIIEIVLGYTLSIDDVLGTKIWVHEDYIPAFEEIVGSYLQYFTWVEPTL